MADQDIDLALRLVTSLPELAHLRVGYESAGWAERASTSRTPTTRCSPPPSVWPRGAPGTAATSPARGRWRRSREGGVPGRGTGRVAYPADVLADVALYEGDPHAALAHYEGEVARARRDADPIRLVWTLFYVAVCHAALRTPDAGLAAARGGGAGRGDDGQPDGAVDGPLRTRLGAQEVRAGPGAGTVRRGGGAGRVGAELLVARHRVDGGRGHPGRARRSGHRGADVRRGARPLGPRRGLDPAVAQPAVRDTVVWSGSVPTTMPSRCTTHSSRRGSPRRWTRPSSPSSPSDRWGPLRRFERCRGRRAGAFEPGPRYRAEPVRYTPITCTGQVRSTTGSKDAGDRIRVRPPLATITVDEIRLDVDLVGVVEHALVFVEEALGHAD